MNIIVTIVALAACVATSHNVAFSSCTWGDSDYNSMKYHEEDPPSVVVHIPVSWCPTCDYDLKAWLQRLKRCVNTITVVVVVHARRKIEFNKRKTEYSRYADVVRWQDMEIPGVVVGDIIVALHRKKYRFNKTDATIMTEIHEMLCGK